MIRHGLESLRTIGTNPSSRARAGRALRKYVGWQVRSRILRRTGPVPWLDHMHLQVETGEGSALAAWLPLPEFDEMMFFLLVLGEENRLIDIGANIGWYTTLGAGTRGCRVHAFEPVPATFALLEGNVRRNDLGDSVTLHPLGLSDEEGELPFVVSGGSSVASPLPGDEIPDGDPVRVPVRRLDDVLTPDGLPTWFKIDTEGYESHILRGAGAWLESPDTRGLVIETRGHVTRYGGSEGELCARLAEHGFEARRFDGVTRRLHSVDAGDLPGDTWFVRRPETLEQELAGAPTITIDGISFPAS